MFGEPLQRPLRGREELRQVAVSNDKLVQDGEYAVGGRRHILRAVGLANRTISLPSDVPVVHGSNVAVQTDIAVVCQDTASALRTLVSSVDDATKVAALAALQIPVASGEATRPARWLKKRTSAG